MVTPAQLRALQIGFRALGYGNGDRAERLADATDVLGLEQPLASFADLQFGQAGYLLGWLRRGAWDGADRDDSAAAPPGPEFGSGPDPAAADPDAAAAAASAAGLAVAVAVLLLWPTRPAAGLVRQLERTAAMPDGSAADSTARPPRPQQPA